MPLSSLFRRQQGSDTAAPTPAEQVQAARTRARQRLVGAIVLLGIGIVGFPLLFESQPRPLPVDVKIEIPAKDAAAPLAVPARRAAASGVVTTAPREETTSPREAPSDAVPDAPAPEAAKPTASAKPPSQRAPAAAATESAAGPDTAAPGAPRPSGATSAAATKATTPATSTTSTTAPAAQPTSPAATRTDAASARFVVQVGAFADRAAAQKTRTQVEGLGLKTYTQVVETSDGARTRVRVGPFESRDEADRAASKLKAAGLPAAVLTL